MAARAGRPLRRLGGVVLWLAAVACAPGAIARATEAAPACLPEVDDSGEIAALAGNELRLADGRTLHLSSLMAPAAAVAMPADLSGRTVELHGLGIADRWGRVPVAGVRLLDSNAEEAWLEAALVEAGAAQVATDVETDCLALLLLREGAARAARRGLWADPATEPIGARDRERLAAAVGRFVLVEGRIVDIGERGNTVYLNFGRHWREDFAIVLRTRDVRALARRGQPVAELAGRLVRVRGYLQRRTGGPLIQAVASQIEVLP